VVNMAYEYPANEQRRAAANAAYICQRHHADRSESAQLLSKMF
jgi:hypothetical protein